MIESLRKLQSKIYTVYYLENYMNISLEYMIFKITIKFNFSVPFIKCSLKIPVHVWLVDEFQQFHVDHQRF